MDTEALVQCKKKGKHKYYLSISVVCWHAAITMRMTLNEPGRHKNKPVRLRKGRGRYRELITTSKRHQYSP